MGKWCHRVSHLLFFGLPLSPLGLPYALECANYEVLSRFERENGGPGGDFEADNAY